MSAAEDAIKTLNQQWYNALASGLGVDKTQFQLAQGATTLGYDSKIIWQIFDSIPPKSVDCYYDPDQHNSLAQAYGAVINNLKPQDNDDLRKALKDKYKKWVQYKSDENSWSDIDEDDPKEAQKKVFKNRARAALMQEASRQPLLYLIRKI